MRLTLLGRLHFVRDSIGNVTRSGDEDFTVFRRVILSPSKAQPQEAGALFVVQFKFARFTFRTNRILSLIPIPFIIAQPGFRSKTWMISHKTEMFQGIYEWDSVDDAERYWDSFPMKLMKRRAVPETLHHEIKWLRGNERVK